MPDKEDQLSPEEKLLRVIQGDTAEESADGESGIAPQQVLGTPTADKPISEDAELEELLTSKAAQESADTSAPKSLEEKPEPVAEKQPRLRLASEEPRKTEPEKTPESAASAKEPAVPHQDREKPAPHLIGASPPPAPGKKHFQREMGISTLNKCLVVVVLGVVIFSAFEIWASVRSKPETAPPDIFAVSPAGKSIDVEIPPIEKILEDFEKRPILGPLDGGKPADQPKPPEPAVATYARKNLDLIGISVMEEGKEQGTEAIVLDKKSKEMYFLTVGEEIVIEDRKLQLEQISEDSVVFTEGGEKIVVK